MFNLMIFLMICQYIMWRQFDLSANLYKEKYDFV